MSINRMYRNIFIYFPKLKASNGLQFQIYIFFSLKHINTLLYLYEFKVDAFNFIIKLDVVCSIYFIFI